jgi:NADH-quinone oxidoreductase subunit M
VDRLPLLLMIAVSIGFGIFPGHLYSVVRSGVDPLIARITKVVPVAEQSIQRPVATGSSIPGFDQPGSVVKVVDR